MVILAMCGLSPINAAGDLQMIGRREFIAGLGAATWPVVARAQQPKMPVIGYLTSRSSESETSMLASFRQGLAETG